MVANDETLVKRRCHECGDTFNTEHLDSTPRCPGGCRNPYLACDACGDIFRPEQPPDAGQKLYLIHGCKRGQVQARLDNPTCRHCGAAKEGVGSLCGCPGDTAKRKADADSLKAKQDAERQHQELQDKERAARLKVSMSKVDLSGLRKVAQRDRQDADLLDRERAVKGRELSRRERRQDGYDADDATEPAAGLTFADFGQEVTLLDVERLPSAFVRDDGETLLYEGVANTIFGEPSSGKSWIALMAVIQQLRAGRRVIWWDNEDRASTLAKRLQLLRATDLIGTPELAFITGDMHLSESAMAGALEFLGGGNGPGLVVLDSATAFTCPKDGADVHPWMTSHIKPWIDAGHTSLTLDHVPKQRKDRPMGAVGSFEKLSIIRGAALYAHGTAWNGQQGGAVHLTVHKDAHGQLPSPQWTVVSTISAEWDGPTLAYTIGLPNAKTEGEDLQDELMEAFDQLGADGARGSQGVRGLLKGKRGRDIDKARDELLQVGMIQRDKVGRAWVYTSVPDDL